MSTTVYFNGRATCRPSWCWSPRALAAAAAQLGSRDLIAAIPKRGWLVLG